MHKMVFTSEDADVGFQSLVMYCESQTGMRTLFNFHLSPYRSFYQAAYIAANGLQQLCPYAEEHFVPTGTLAWMPRLGTCILTSIATVQV